MDNFFQNINPDTYSIPYPPHTHTHTHWFLASTISFSCIYFWIEFWFDSFVAFVVGLSHLQFVFLNLRERWCYVCVTLLKHCVTHQLKSISDTNLSHTNPQYHFRQCWINSRLRVNPSQLAFAQVCENHPFLNRQLRYKIREHKMFNIFTFPGHPRYERAHWWIQ